MNTSAPYTTSFCAFGGDLARKQAIVSRLQQHLDAGTLRQGNDDECAVYCTIGIYNHAIYASRLNVSEDFPHTMETLYEALLPDAAGPFAVACLQALPPGANTAFISLELGAWALTLVAPHLAGHPVQEEALQRVTEMIEQALSGRVFEASERELVTELAEAAFMAGHLDAADIVWVTSTIGRNTPEDMVYLFDELWEGNFTTVEATRDKFLELLRNAPVTCVVPAAEPQTVAEMLNA